ncbi:MAG: HIT family protein [bacterium]|nr:HIT family protein [bacterium]
MADFEVLKIKDYKYWSVFLNENQTYLGRCVIWCKRENALDLTDATLDERAELFEILNQMRSALQTAFKADWINYAFLGNGTRHLHCHLVPRYASERTFAGEVFKDERWGKSYRTNHDLIAPKVVLEQIVLEIKKYLD